MYRLALAALVGLLLVSTAATDRSVDLPTGSAGVLLAVQPVPEPPPAPTPPAGGGPTRLDPLVEQLIPIAAKIPECALAFFGVKPAVTEKLRQGGLTPDEIAELRETLKVGKRVSGAVSLLEMFEEIEEGDWTRAIVLLEQLKRGPLLCAEIIVEGFLPGQQGALSTCLKGKTPTARECRRLIALRINELTTDQGPIGQPQPDLVPPQLPGTVPAGIVGGWSGSVTQDGYPRSPYSAEITVTGGSIGSTVATGRYPSLGCTVHWELKEATLATIVVREVVDQGPECVNVDVTLTLNADSTLGYRFDGGAGRATLRRTS